MNLKGIKEFQSAIGDAPIKNHPIRSLLWWFVKFVLWIAISILCGGLILVGCASAIIGFRYGVLALFVVLLIAWIIGLFMWNKR